jgi:putative spermidine/putrescine transport system substrate-binding protein
MGLPYILGDKDPSDPKDGWDKTWTFLKELGRNIEYYPAGTGALMKELGEGSRDMVASHVGWDINPRALGVVPKEAKVAFIKGFHWVLDAHYICIPRGISNAKLAVMIDLVGYLLSKEAQAVTYDAGYFYPGPAVKDVPLMMAPDESQQVIKEFGRDEYAPAIRRRCRCRPTNSSTPSPAGTSRWARRRRTEAVADVTVGWANGGRGVSVDARPSTRLCPRCLT